MEPSPGYGILQVSSSEGYVYQVTPSTGLYRFSAMIRDVMELFPEDSSEEPSILKHVTTESLLVLIEWCDHHRDAPDKFTGEKKSSGPLYGFTQFHPKLPHVDPWDEELLTSLKARVFYDCITAASYLLITEFIEVATDVWIRCAEPRVGKTLERLLLHEKCSPDVEMNPQKDYDYNRKEIARLYLEEKNLSPVEQSSVLTEGEQLDNQLESLEIR